MPVPNSEQALPPIPYLDRFEARTHANDAGEQLRYRWLAPPRPRPRRRYPLVIFLHGMGERGDDNQSQLRNGVAEWLASDAARAEYPAFYLVPQCPPEEYWAGPSAGLSRPAALVMQTLRALRRTCPVDPARVYLGGLSMGGFGVWRLLSRYPRTFAAAVMICGGGNPARARSLARIPLWLFHGAEDDTVSPEQSRAMVAALQRAGGNVRYTEYPGVGHASWFPAFQEPELLPWLFAQRRPTRRPETL